MKILRITGLALLLTVLSMGVVHAQSALIPTPNVEISWEGQVLKVTNIGSETLFVIFNIRLKSSEVFVLPEDEWRVRELENGIRRMYTTWRAGGLINMRKIEPGNSFLMLFTDFVNLPVNFQEWERAYLHVQSFNGCISHTQDWDWRNYHFPINWPDYPLIPFRALNQ